MNKRPPLRHSAPVESENDGIIEGRNAVIEALRAGVTIDKIFIMKGETDATLGHIASTARALDARLSSSFFILSSLSCRFSSISIAHSGQAHSPYKRFVEHESRHTSGTLARGGLKHSK